MADLRHYFPGQRFITPGFYNAAVDAAIAHRGKLFNTRDGTPGIERSQSIILVRNQSGEDIDRFGILQPSNPVFSADIEAAINNPIAMLATLPGEPTQASVVPFCVAQEPIPDGLVGRAVISGITFARISSDATAGRYARPTQDEQYLLGDNWGNAYLLWAETTDEEVGHALILMGIPMPPQPIFGLLTSNLLAGGAATMDRYAVDQTGGLTGDPIEEGLDIADPSMLNDDQELETGCPVSAVYDGPILVLTGYKCDFEPEEE